MKTLDFCGGWQVGYLEGDLREPVTLPHDAMLREKRTQGSAGDVHIGWFEGHDYEYVKCFAASDEMLSGHALVEFEGVYHNAQVYINDVLVAERPYGYSGFYADMTGHLKRCDHGTDQNTEIRQVENDPAQRRKRIADFEVAPAVLASNVPDIPAGLPSALLERRPDIAAAAAKPIHVPQSVAQYLIFRSHAGQASAVTRQDHFAVEGLGRAWRGGTSAGPPRRGRTFPHPRGDARGRLDR